MKLFSRYNRSTLSATVLIFTIAGILYYFLLKAILVHELDEALLERKKQVELYTATNQRFPERNQLDETILEYKTTARTGKVPLSIRLSSRPDSDHGHNVSFRELAYMQMVNGQMYEVSIFKELEGTRTLLKYIIGITLSIVLLIVAVTVFINRYLLARLWKPFHQALETLGKFKVTETVSIKLPLTDIDEFQLLNHHLEKTVGDAQREYHLLKEFTENASHEIQTPLAILRSKLDLFIQSEDLGEKQISLLKAMYDPIRKLSRLNQSLLLLMKIENNQFLTKDMIDLKERVEEKIRQFAELWQNKEIRLATSLDESSVRVNSELIDILLNNLFSNATWHNRSKGLIKVDLDRDALVIRNSGVDHALDVERVFRRFFKDRPEAASNGLGLAIIKEIAQANGFRVRYDFEGGLHVFTVLF